MTTIQAELNRLESWLREEIDAKQRIVALIELQESAIRRNRPDELDAASKSIDREIITQGARDKRRLRIFGVLAGQWGVSPDSLRISSIAERAGTSGERVKGLQGELRQELARLLKRNRRLHVLVKVHRQVVHDAISTLGGGGLASPFSSAGNLVDAEV